MRCCYNTAFLRKFVRFACNVPRTSTSVFWIFSLNLKQLVIQRYTLVYMCVCVSVCACILFFSRTYSQSEVRLTVAGRRPYIPLLMLNRYRTVYAHISMNGTAYSALYSIWRWRRNLAANMIAAVTLSFAVVYTRICYMLRLVFGFDLCSSRQAVASTKRSIIPREYGAEVENANRYRCEWDGNRRVPKYTCTATGAANYS